MSFAPAGMLIVVAYDSGSRGNPALRGRTAALAKAIAGGARVAGQTEVMDMHLGRREPDWEALDAADAIIFGCPTYMGSASARMKAFMEESLSPQFLERRWQDKLAAGFTNSAGMSGDKLCTLQQLAGFAAQHGMIWIPLGQLPGWQSSHGTAADPNRLASFLGLMAQSNSDQGPDRAPPESDRRTGELFGRRIALITSRWATGHESARPAHGQRPSPRAGGQSR
jgi:NAD(P)H dehydrogenase (quinone)